jgi:hypothetical protein
METDSAGEREHVPDALRELDCEAILRVQKVLRSGRFLACCGLLVLAILPLNLLEGLLAVALCLAVLNFAAFVTGRLLFLSEIVLYAAILVVLVVWAVEIAALAASDFDECVKFLLALIPSALAAYLLYWTMYPGPLGHVFDRRVTRFALPLVIGLLLFLTRQAVPSHRGGEFFLLSAGILALCLLIKVFIPLAWSAPGGRSLQLLEALAQNRKARRSRGYIFYLFTHANSRLGAILYAMGCPLLACVSYLYLVGLGPFREIGELDPALGWPFVKGLLFAGGLLLAGLSYRKALETLAEGVDQAQVKQLTAAGGFTLYLRSFQDDESKFDLASSGWPRLLVLSSLWGVYLRFFRFMRLEEMIARTLWAYRPVLSIASTSNVTAVMPSLVSYVSPGVGALRFRLPDETWQAGVLQLAQKAECIVMTMAGTPGLRWEFQQLALRSELREKLVLLVPPWTPDETATRWPSILDQSGGTQDGPTVRWRGLFGESRDGPRITKEVLLRTVAIKFDRGSGGVLLTAAEHSAAAYRLALHLAQLPPQETALAARPVVEKLVPGTAPSTGETATTTWMSTPDRSLGTRTLPSSNVTSPRPTTTWASPSVTRAGTTRLFSSFSTSSSTTETRTWPTLAIVCGIGLVLLAVLNFWPDATTFFVAIGAGLLVGGLLKRGD